ncbi:transposase [Arthrobacter sp. PAMC 25486]|uniref:transposase n=1 Tax=Arthrobacter sp. PAMC 25486 TaxID=1494608 RepID=UPI001C1DDB54|nr:transposase [Arthrobacter sp. PAMC 25486]
MYRIARRVAKDRVISTVDPEATHGHKTSALGFDGYKGHVAMNPDSEIITATDVTAGNTGDAERAKELLAEELASLDAVENREVPEIPAPENTPAVPLNRGYTGMDDGAATADRAGASVATCPANITMRVRPSKDGGTASFGAACASCPLATPHTTAKSGRSITISPHEDGLVRARTTQRESGWRAEYRATRPKVERKTGPLMRRKHGGQRARDRGRTKVDADFSLLAAAVNIARFGLLGISRIVPSTPVGVPVLGAGVRCPALEDRWSGPTGPQVRPADPKTVTDSRFREEHGGQDRLSGTKKLILPGKRTSQTAVKHQSPRHPGPWTAGGLNSGGRHGPVVAASPFVVKQRLRVAARQMVRGALVRFSCSSSRFCGTT